jgi:hypothetical protein
VEMEWYYVILIMVGSIAALMMLGVPVAFAFLGVNIVGSFLFMGGVNGLNLVVANAASHVTVFTLAPIPLFMLICCSAGCRDGSPISRWVAARSSRR